MFFLKRFIKTLKGFVMQRARLEGIMEEEWLLQESMVYITQFLTSMDPDMPLKWHKKDDEVAQGKGVPRKMGEVLRKKINKFCILNSNDMQKWIQRYEEARSQRTQVRMRWRALHMRKPFPRDHDPLPKEMSHDSHI